MARPVFIGMNNPASPSPEAALALDKPGTTGHRLWTLASARTGITQEEWLRLTDRRNLVDSEKWDFDRAWARARELEVQLKDRTVIVLGGAVAGCFKLGSTPLKWRDDRDWAVMPHPSGNNFWYNCPVHTAAAEVFLEDLLEACAAQ